MARGRSPSPGPGRGRSGSAGRGKGRGRSPAQPDACDPAGGLPLTRCVFVAACMTVLMALVLTVPHVNVDSPPQLATGGDSAAYKVAKEAFYTGHSGGSSWEIVLVTAIAPVSVFCVQVVQLSLKRPGPLANVLINFLLVACPLHAAFVLPDCAVHLMLGLLAATAAAAAAVGMRLRAWGAALDDMARAMHLPRKAFVTAYRGTMMLATCLAILAVDFPSFPRRFAKTETFGVSVMDAGVGSVLLTQAMVSPVARMTRTSAMQRVGAAMRSASPLVLLGLARVASTAAADYHTHVTEYGVHWNFFFTLAAISVLGNALPLQGWAAAVGAGVLSAAYEYALSSHGLQDYILHAPRNDLLSANREGVFGCAGYAAVFFAGVALGQLIFGGRGGGGGGGRPSALWWIGLCAWLVAVSAALWGLLVALERTGLRVSRRMVNLPYVVWTLAYNALLLALFLLGELLVHFVEKPESKPSAVMLSKPRFRTVQAFRRYFGESCQMLCDALNRNLLAVFLGSNLLTGAVNMSLPTLEASWWQGVAITALYSFSITSLAAAAHHRKLNLKFW